ncbi:MAG: GNAT family N-acetyltransferase [Chitinophagaceae bacterium]|nr:GNAT family N-acetyltransferase [Chitinophagaceae bacterium]
MLSESKVSIRPLSEIHAETSYKWRNNPTIWRYTFNKPDRVVSLKMEKEWIKKVLSNKNERRFAIYYQEIYVGNIYLTSITEYDAYVGLFLGDPNFHGKGVGIEALSQVLEFATQHLHLKNIYLRVKKENTPAFRLYSKVGFEIIEEMKEYFKMKKSLI